MRLSGKTYWIVGASEGLGRALAKSMDGAGARLILSSRDGDRLRSLAASLRDARPIEIDVTDPVAVAQAANLAGDLDGVVYMAANYTPIKALAWDTDTIEAMFEVNLLGAVRVLGHVLPQFMAKNSGHVVLIGSLAGFRGLPGAIGYGASKAALMHLAEEYCRRSA